MVFSAATGAAFAVLSVIFLFAFVGSTDCRELVFARIVRADNDGLLLNQCNFGFEFDATDRSGASRTCSGSQVLQEPCQNSAGSAVLAVCYNPYSEDPCAACDVSPSPDQLNPGWHAVALAMFIACVSVTTVCAVAFAAVVACRPGARRGEAPTTSSPLPMTAIASENNKIVLARSDSAMRLID